MPMTDYLVVAALTYYFLKGWLMGLMRTILGPISLVVGIIMGFTYYQKTHNVTYSLLIGAISPFIFRFLASLLLALWTKAANDKPDLSLPSRMAGSAFSILWGGSYLAIFLILLGMIPLRVGWLKTIHADVTGSRSYALLNQWIGEKSNLSSSLSRVTGALEDPKQMEQYKNTKEFAVLMEDEQLQEILSDPKTVAQIQNQDYAKLLSNPKIQKVFQNEELLKKILALNKVIIQSEANQKQTTAAPSTPTKTVTP